MPKIRIQTNGGPEDVDAKLFGALALHEGINRRGQWNITHVATGKALAKNLRKQKALGVIEKLSKLDWENYGEGRKLEFQEAVREAARSKADIGRAPKGSRDVPARGVHDQGGVPVPGHGERHGA